MSLVTRFFIHLIKIRRQRCNIVGKILHLCCDRMAAVMAQVEESLQIDLLHRAFVNNAIGNLFSYAPLRHESETEISGHGIDDGRCAGAFPFYFERNMVHHHLLFEDSAGAASLFTKNKVLIVEILDGDGLLLGEWMVIATDNAKRVEECRFGHDFWVVDNAFHQCDIQLVM